MVGVLIAYSDVSSLFTTSSYRIVEFTLDYAGIRRLLAYDGMALPTGSTQVSFETRAAVAGNPVDADFGS